MPQADHALGLEDADGELEGESEAELVADGD